MLHYVEALFIDDIDHIVQQVGLMKQDPRKLALLPEDTILLYYVGLSGWMSYPQLKREKDPLVEVTHIVARHSENRFFSEGLAIYFQERFGEDHGFPNFSGAPLDDLVWSNRSRVFDISALANDNDIFKQVGTEQREIAYIQAGSFISFLVEAYGENKLVELHNSWTLNYKKIYGKDIKELEVEWKKSTFR